MTLCQFECVLQGSGPVAPESYIIINDQKLIHFDTNRKILKICLLHVKAMGKRVSWHLSLNKRANSISAVPLPTLSPRPPSQHLPQRAVGDLGLLLPLSSLSQGACSPPQETDLWQRHSMTSETRGSLPRHFCSLQKTFTS